MLQSEWVHMHDCDFNPCRYDNFYTSVIECSIVGSVLDTDDIAEKIPDIFKVGLLDLCTVVNCTT